jgi:3-dehydroquinate synthase
MVAAARIGVNMGVTPAKGVVEFLTRLCEAFGLPTAIDCTMADYAAAIGRDKKGSGEDISFILLDTLGAAHAHKMSREALLKEIEAL